MTRIYVWPDATYLDASEYNEVEFNHKGEDLITIDLQEIVDGRTALVYTGGLTVEPVLKDRLSELLQAEHQLKTLTPMFCNYRNTMREYTWQIPQLKETIEKLEADYQGALARVTELEQSLTAEEMARLSREMSDLIAKHETEMRTTLQARDQWVKELQGKLREATSSDSEELLEENRRLKSQLAGATARIRKQVDGYDAQAKLADWRARAEAAEDKATFCAKERDECAAKVDNLETLLSELYQVLGALDAPVKVLDLVTYVLDGHGFDPEADSLLPFTEERDSDDDWKAVVEAWRERAATAEAELSECKTRHNALVADLQFQVAEGKAELAKLKNTSAISSDIEDNLRKERDRLGDLLDKHGVCSKCGDMFEHHEDEPLASCACQTAEWGNGVSTPYMALQRALREARDAEQCQSEKADELEITVDELKEQISEMKRIAAVAISTLQEIE